MALATALLVFWAQFIRASSTDQPFAFSALTNLSIDPYFFGVAILEMIVPVALLFVLSRTPFFRRVVTSEPTPVDGGKLAAALGLLLLLSLVARYTLGLVIDTHVMSGFFFVFVAGLIGGWQTGLTTGALVLFANALFDYTPWHPDHSGDFKIADYVGWFILHNMNAMAALWVGAITGFLHVLIPLQRRFAIITVVGLGLLAEAIYRAALVYSVADPSFFTYTTVQFFSITLLALLAFALMVRYVQVDESRLQAEEAKLELAQMNLALTQTKLALAQAELRALHAQINPHFLFNSLNTIRYFIRTDPNIARDLLTRLSEIFQRALNAGEFVPLREEIAHTEAYLALEKARLDERLNVIWTNMAKDLLEYPVPTLILQPVVENAVIHGLAPKSEGGTIHIVLNRVGNELLMQVDDDGVGIAASANSKESGNGIKVLDPSTAIMPAPQAIEKALEQSDDPDQRQRPSIGLRNVAERLRVLYGEGYQPVVEPRADHGTRVMIRIPITRPS
jgi:LytS/YehU family sensor histidine kinase